MTTTHQSSTKQAKHIVQSINQIKSIPDSSNCIQTKKQSQISQYYNLQGNNFSSPTNSNHLFESAVKIQLKFASSSTERSTSPKFDGMLQTRNQNFKESHVEQSLQKAFSMNNKNPQRIPFKRHVNLFDDLNYGQGQKRSYNFYEPKYTDYYLKEDKHFWMQTFEKFQEKKGSSHTIEFPSFNQKEQSKISDRFSDVHKVSQIEEKPKKSGLEKYASKAIMLYAFTAVFILLAGLRLFFPK